MADYIYLVEDIIEAAENDGSEFVSAIPRMVNRAEERLVKALDDYGLVTTTSIEVSSGKNKITLPTGTRTIRNVRLDDSGTRIMLLQRTDEFLYDYWPVSASTGTPKYYAKTNNTEIVVAPTASATYGGEISYTARPTTLTSTTPDNYFTEFCYDALFFGSMVEAGDFMKNYSVSTYYEQRYQNAVELLRNQSRRTRRDDMQGPASALGDNTIGGTQ